MKFFRLLKDVWFCAVLYFLSIFVNMETFSYSHHQMINNDGVYQPVDAAPRLRDGYGGNGDDFKKIKNCVDSTAFFNDKKFLKNPRPNNDDERYSDNSRLPSYDPKWIQSNNRKIFVSKINSTCALECVRQYPEKSVANIRVEYLPNRYAEKTMESPSKKFYKDLPFKDDYNSGQDEPNRSGFQDDFKQSYQSANVPGLKEQLLRLYSDYVSRQQNSNQRPQSLMKLIDEGKSYLDEIPKKLEGKIDTEETETSTREPNISTNSCQVNCTTITIDVSQLPSTWLSNCLKPKLSLNKILKDLGIFCENGTTLSTATGLTLHLHLPYPACRQLNKRSRLFRDSRYVASESTASLAPRRQRSFTLGKEKQKSVTQLHKLDGKNNKLSLLRTLTTSKVKSTISTVKHQSSESSDGNDKKVNAILRSLGPLIQNLTFVTPKNRNLTDNRMWAQVDDGSQQLYWGHANSNLKVVTERT